MTALGRLGPEVEPAEERAPRASWAGSALDHGRTLAARIVSRVGTILVASFLIFVGINAAPGDPVRAVLGAHATPAAIAAERQALGLNHPLLDRYWLWLTGVLQGHWGTSLVYKTTVGSLISARITTTLLIVGYSLVLILLFGLLIGIIGAVVRPLATPVMVLTGLLLAIPAFVAAQVLVSVFALHFNWFPVSGGGSGLGDQLYHLTLPAIALAGAWCAWLAQVTRASIADEVDREHVDTARGRGINALPLFRRHVLRNAALPIVTVSGLSLAGLFAGAVVVENAFGLNGIGTLLVNSVSAKDYQVVLDVSVLYVVIFVVVTSAIDALNVLLDPRVRQGSRA